MPGPLDGVVILDLSRLFPGPYATLLLSDLGADVIKVEDPSGGDYIRYFPPLCDDGFSAAFHALNRGKRSVSLDLRSDDGRAALLNLAKDADVLIESFRPGVLEKLGVAPAQLHEVNPQLIVCRISGYGQEGPDALRAGHDLNYAARAGVLGLMKEPAALPVQIADLCGGAWPAALQITAALYGRKSGSGEPGAVIDVSMTEGARAMLVMPLARQAVDSDEKIGAGEDMLTGSLPCYGVYPTKDGHISVGALEPKFWMGLCSALGLDDVMGSGLSRDADGADARTLLADKLKQRTTEEWSAFFADFDCCIEPVRDPATAGDDDVQLSNRPTTVSVSFENGPVNLPATPLSLNAGSRPTAPGPGLGADNDELLGRR